MNKVFCSQWLSDRQIVFGTKCNKLMVYDVATLRLDQIPSLHGRQTNANGGPVTDQQCGIHSIKINPSRYALNNNNQFFITIIINKMTLIIFFLFFLLEHCSVLELEIAMK